LQIENERKREDEVLPWVLVKMILMMLMMLMMRRKEGMQGLALEVSRKDQSLLVDPILRPTMAQREEDAAKKKKMMMKMMMMEQRV